MKKGKGQQVDREISYDNVKRKEIKGNDEIERKMNV